MFVMNKGFFFGHRIETLVFIKQSLHMNITD